MKPCLLLTLRKDLKNTMKLLTSNTKIDKSMKEHQDYEATILQMLPSKNFCVDYKSCIKTCLAFQGFAKVYPSVIKSRKAKTNFFVNDRKEFLLQVKKELRNQEKRAKKKGKKPAVRLNGFTDIDWEFEQIPTKCGTNSDNIFSLFPTVQFWDYTADYEKVLRYIDNPRKNYHLTFSFKYDKKTSETNINQCNTLAKKGVSIAVVDSDWDKWETVLFKEKIDIAWMKHKTAHIIYGDLHDFRWLDHIAKDMINVVLLSEKK
tara:strand:- start:6957 stop:7739 length:783 start_codon:yes stop_codon:yes gene_type:complete